MAFTGAMNLSIDKDDFWQLSSDAPTTSSPPPQGISSGSAFADEMHHHTHTQPRFSSDSSFFDQYVNMEMEGGPAGMPTEEETHHSSGESFFIPLSSPHEHGHGMEEDGLELEGGGLSSPAPGLPAPESISVSGTASSHYSHKDDDDQSVDMMSIPTSISSIDGSAKSHTSFPPQSQTVPRQDGDSTNHVVLGRLNAETLEQRRRLLSGRRGMSHHQPTGGSISDSELLRLEGLSVNSPRGLVVAASAACGVPSSSSQTISQPQLHRPITPSISTSAIFTSTSTPPNTGAFPLVTSKSFNNLTGRHTGGNQPTTADDIDLCNLGDKRQNNLKAAGSRKFESIYATIRRAVGGGQHRTRLNHSSKTSSNNHHQQPKTAPIPQAASPSHTESAKKATRRLASETDLMWQGMPISPPLTDMNSHAHQGHHGHHGHHAQHSGEPNPFVAGLMDDPFFDSSMAFGNPHHHSGLASAAEINGKSAAFNATIPNTPLHTPNIKNETLGGDDGSNFFPATTKPWSLDNRNFVTSDNMSNATSFLSSAENTVMDTWSFDPSTDGGNNLAFTTNNEGSHNSHRNHHNLTIQVPSYLHHETHHTPGSEDLSGQGLMIHMPQPLTPNSAPLLSSQIHQTHNGMSLHDANVYPFPDGSGTPQHHMSSYLQQQQQPPHSGSRRPKPRAPSSGARYHSHLPGGPHSISPRKQRRPSSSSESPSPTPMAQQQGGRRSRSMSRRQASVSGGGGGSAHRKSTTALVVTGPSSDMQANAVRKRRSTSSWRGPRRSQSGDVGIGGGGGISLDGANGGIGFVNYTPNDHNVLMTGVAPSGSSKTKMRREKEAMERQRKLSEAVVKMVTNAGVDVSMLKEEGIVI